MGESRVATFRPEIVTTLHDNLASLYAKNNYPPSDILNVDEIGFQGSRDKGLNILAKKGTKSVYGITCDSCEWMIVLCCVNAASHAIPSYYIFKGNRFNANYIQDSEPGAAIAMQRKAWMTRQTFQAWLDHSKNAIMQDMGFENRHSLIHWMYPSLSL